MKVKFSQAAHMISVLVTAGLVPFVKGSPATGKSSLAHQFAKQHNLKLIDFRLSQCDPTDLTGFPNIADGRSDYFPMKQFPLAHDPLPVNDEGKPYEGWVLFLDELTSAPRAIQAAAYKLVLDRQVGSYDLHKKVAIIAAGNLESDNAVVEPMSTALQSRICSMELVTSTEDWLNWAVDNDIDFRIRSYIKFAPDKLYTFNPNHTDDTYASPRTWEFTDRILKVVQDDRTNLRPMLAGTISEGVSTEFLAFIDIYKDLPSFDEVLKTPEKIKIPEEPSIRYALTGMVSNNITETNATDVMKFVNRLPIEFQVVTLKDAIRKNNKIFKHPEIMKWAKDKANELY